MMADFSKLKVGSSPHIRSEDSVSSIMLDVILALVLPTLVVAVFNFGWRALTLVLVSCCGCMVFEWLYEMVMKKPVTLRDCSAIVTGILIAYCVPVTAPMWMVLIGDAFAIIIVKQLYGGIGKNFLNPALAARAFLFSWPLLMNTWSEPRSALPLFETPVDVITAATPLQHLGNLDLNALPPIKDLLLGMIPGSLGETSAIALIAGGLYLLYRRVITWHIPVSYLGTVALLTFFFPRGQDPLHFMLAHLLSGGLMLGAIFMATDYTSSPITKKGQLIYGVGCGLLTVFIRYFGSYPEGVTYAILVMNACVFLIEKITLPRRYGYESKLKSRLKTKKVKGGEGVEKGQ